MQHSVSSKKRLARNTPTLQRTVSVKIAALRHCPSKSAMEKRKGKSNAAVKKWMKKQERPTKPSSGKRRFVSSDTSKRFSLGARSNLDDIAHILYGKDVYSLPDGELDAVEALYWKAVSSIFDPGEWALRSFQEQRSKPYSFRRRWV